MHNIWIATDLHLYNVENDPRHPYRTQRNLGNLADNYGSDIQDDDLLIFLGDLYDPATGDAEKVSSIIHNIKGTKIMCRGNHDTESKDFYRELGFDAVCDILRIHNLVFSHKPVRVNPDELNIHGHLHSEKLSSLGYQHINAYPINHNKEDQPVLIEDLIDSAIVQNRDEVHGPSFNQQQMDAFTSLVSNETYHDVLDLSDEFTMSPMDEAATKRKKTEAEKLYFLSEHDDWDESIIKPRIPNNFLTQSGYEDATIPRVCFSTFIDGCLRALSQNLKGKVFYVYQPVGKYEVIKPTLEQVPDRAVTRERWITKPVELHCIGKIQVGEAKGNGIKYVYGEDNEHSAMLYDWEWEWIEKINESVQPSIVSLSVSEKDPRVKRDIMDEILFPDVDSTRFFEADDNAPEAEADLKKNIKVLDKNDVAADGQTTLDESSHKKKKKKAKTPEMIFTFVDSKTHETVEIISILAQDLFHEKIMIHPERIDAQKIATMEKVEELIEYFNDVASGEAVAENGLISDHYIAGSYLLNAYRKRPEKGEIEKILIPDLPEEKFKRYVKDMIDYLNQVESAICGLICANMAMIRLAIDDVCAECLTSYGRNKVIKEAKQFVDDHEKDIKSTYTYYARNPSTGNTEELKTITFNYYGACGLNKRVIISGEMYDNKTYHKIMKPSRFLVRLGVYDVVIVVHGNSMIKIGGGYRWEIEPLQLDKDTIVDNLDDAVRYFRNRYHGRILVISCNESSVVPDNKLYDVVDYASHTVLFESTDVGLPATVGSTSSILKSLINYVPKKIKVLNRIEARILTALDEFNFMVAPTEFNYINVDEKLGYVAVSIKTKEVKGPKDFRVEMGSSLNELFMYYEKVLYRFMMFGKLIQQHMSGVIVENAYTWNIQGINLKALTPSFNAVNQDLFVYDDMPSLGYRYTDIDEYANDIELFRATNAWFYGDITLQSDSINEDTYDAWKDIYYKITNPMTINIANVSETPDVLFTKNITPESLVKIFQLAYMPAIPDGWKTMVKISTGEPGGHNYLKPELIGELVKLVHGTICDTVTAYEGGRDTKEGQLKTMKDHGFMEIGNVDVLDGDGEIVVPVKNGYMLQDVNAGKNILGYDFHIVLTHFKGHQMAGFGGSIKNVAIGCASRRGKSQIHTYGSTAEMTVGFLDQYDQQSFLKAMVDAAKSFVDVMKITGPVLYINIANNLSVDCDCNAHPADPTMTDLGIFASWDPVAVDSACIDAVYHAKDSKDLVERIESKDGTDILEYAQEAGMGSRSYHLINIDQVDQPITEASKEYKRMDDIHPIDREEKKKIADKYGLRAVGQELPGELREKEKTPEERYKELHEKRVKSLKKARKVKKRKAFTRKVKSHLPGVKNEDVELFYEDAEAVDTSDDSTPDGVEHSPLYGDKKDFFYNYDYPKDANSYAERLKLEESATKQEEEEPLTKQELASLGIRDLRTLQRWMKNNIRYKNFTQLMTPREVMEEKKGSCHDQVVFEMAALKALDYSPTAYFVLEHDDKPNNSQGGETHSYVVVKDNGGLYWLENAWEQYAGVNEITNPKFIKQAHKERAWGDSNKFKELEVVRFAGQPGDSLQQLVDRCFNDKQEIDKPKKNESVVETGTPIWETYQFELEEPIQFLDRMDEAATTKTQKLYPVYIMLVHSGTAVSNAIKVVSHAEFSHAAISFDSSMDEMYSFARKDPRNPFIGGFRFESVGRGFYDNKHCPYAVYVVPCTETQIKKMKKRLNYFIQNQSKFKFDFVGLVKNYLGIVDNPEYRWFCSRFVADILNAGAPKKNPYVEEPSLQDPDDFKNTDYATYVIGGSDLMKYDQKLVDKRTKQILREEEMSRKVQNESVIYDLDRDNPFGDLVLGYQFAMMDESVVDRFLEYLKSFKLKFDKNGNIVIRRREYDQLDTHFRQSLKLIKAAEKAGNLDTVKYELCKIYYMISLIDRHYLGRKTSEKSEKVRKDMINLRAVMINVMHQHLKYVSTMDPQFNFQSYYASTKYGDDTTISPQFLTAFGRTIVTALN